MHTQRKERESYLPSIGLICTSNIADEHNNETLPV